MNRISFRLVVFLALGLATIAGPRRALAAAQVVTDCGDTGAATQLRDKISAAQNSGGGTITFNCGPNVVLNPLYGPLPTITTGITINGGNKITLSGNNASRLFVVDTGGTLTLNNLTLTRGYADGDGGAIYSTGTLNINTSKFLDNQTTSNGNGGAIVSFGMLNISNSDFENNRAASGGALYPTGGSSGAKITGSRFHLNEATGTTYGWAGAIYASAGAVVAVHSSTFDSNKATSGGAIYAYQEASLTLDSNTLLTLNNAANFGGAIYNDGSTTILRHVTISENKADGCTASCGAAAIYNRGYLVVDNSTIRDNLTPSGDGGGIYNDLDSTASIAYSTLSGNFAKDGGGIYNGGGTATLINVTLSDNVGYDEGGGLYNRDGTATLTNVTMSGNFANNPGGSIFNAGSATLTNSLLAKRSDGDNCGLLSIQGSFNLSDDATCNFGAGRDNVNIGLGPLANNGGPTLTHMPSNGSPAIDGGTAIGCPITDQRGALRAGAGSACDVGAVEYGAFIDKIYLPIIRR